MSLLLASMVLVALGDPSRGTPDEPAPQAKGGNVTQPAEATVDDLVNNATIIFRGTVEKVKAATLAEVEPTAETLVVKVDDVLHGPQDFRDYSGQAVTVQLSGAPVPAVGQKATFYANAWLSGDGLAVQGVARIAAGAALAGAAGPTAAIQRKAEQPLRDRLAAAQVVVVGKVTAVRPVPAPAVAAAAAALTGGASPRVSEHDPDWHEAVVQVASVEKGQLAAAAAAANTVTVVFPASKDVLWYQAPKFQMGQEGTFLLHKTPTNRAVAAMVTARSADQPATYSAPEPADVQPADQAARVRSLLGAP